MTVRKCDRGGGGRVCATILVPGEIDEISLFWTLSRGPKKG